MRADDFYALAKGAVTHVPWLYTRLARNRAGGTGAATYCYGVWFKHLTLLSEIGTDRVPATVIELGPGGSLGTGCAALFSGAARYIGVDALPLADNAGNARVARELLEMFRTRAPFRPSGWPDFSRHLRNGFPIVLDGLDLASGKADAVLDGMLTEYRAPWSGGDFVDPGSGDLVFSHSVLEHIMDLPAAMRAAYRALRPGGLMSHQFDLQSHGITRTWDGHRAMSDRVWRAAVGRRAFTINRLPYSAVVHAIEAAGFEIVTGRRCIAHPTMSRAELRPDWAGCSDE